MLVMCSEMSKIYCPDCCMSMDTYYIYAGNNITNSLLK